jgi:DNA-binding NarL/FixJ family response regulator
MMLISVSWPSVDSRRRGLVKRLLLADDNRDMLTALDQMLRQEFLIVGALSSGVSVLAQVNDLNPDIILLDVSLGDLSGFQVARCLRHRGCPSNIVFLSVHENPEFLQAAVDLGVSGYVFKSRISRDLLHALQAVAMGGQFFSDAKA